ncbi:tol-pal system protein YbgF [Arenibacterium sp. CAU 1754]
MRFAVFALLVPLGLGAAPAVAQDQQTLADVRQELTVLYVEIQKLKRELSTTGAPSVDVAGSSVLDRVAAMESELQRLTAQTERLDNRVNRIVTDGTNRIGDLEFRLVELEGGDLSKLGETTTLGGVEALPAGAGVAETPAPTIPTVEMAVGEKADYDAAVAALSEGSFQKAAELFAGFNQSYPGSPLAAEADLNRGKALDNLGDTREAARAYLASFSSDANGPVAPAALFELGSALGRLGQTQQACVTLGEVGVRFPDDAAVQNAREEMVKLGCS